MEDEKKLKRVEKTEKDLQKGDKYFTPRFQETIKHDGEFSISSVLKKLLKQFMRTREFYRVAIPVEFILPQSALEFFSLMFTPTSNFLQVNSFKTAEERMKVIVEWFLSNNVNNYFSGFFHAKPYKFVNEKQGVEIDSTLSPDSKMYFNSGSLFTTGSFKITIMEGKEIYSITFPENLASGIFYGESKIVPYGKCTIECEATGVSTILHFSTNNTLKGEMKRGKSVLFKISGNSIGDINITNVEDKKESLLVDTVECMQHRVVQYVKDINDQDENMSRRKWLKVTKNILKKKMDRAHDAKQHIEEMERERRKKVKYQPKYFKKIGEKEKGEHKCVVDNMEMMALCK